jgi:hypothetical protein
MTARSNIEAPISGFSLRDRRVFGTLYDATIGKPILIHL